MNAKKIVFPTDFSTTSKACLPYAATLARESGATLLIVYVQEPSLAHGGSELYYAFPPFDRQAVLKSLEEVVPADPAVAYEHHVVMGDPATEIIQLARSEGADLIVMGTHGRTGLTRLMMGSVAEAVVRRAPCPVLTLKHALASNGPPSGAREVDLANIGGGI